MARTTPSRSNGASEPDRFHLLVDSITEYALYMMDVNGFVMSWNVGAQRMKGYLDTEIIGQHYSRFFRPADREAGVPQQILARAAAEGRHEVEGWRVRKDGSLFWVQAVVHRINSDDGGHIGFAKVTRDMTERREAELRLADSERRFRLLVRSVVDYAIFMLDPSGVVTNWNIGAERIHGYAEAEIVNQHFSRFYTWQDRAAGLPARNLEIAAREGRLETEGWRVRKDGTRFWAAVVLDAVREEKGELIGFAKITRDITGRRAQQQALIESERQFRLLMNSVIDYALFMLDLNGNVVSWNAGAERIKGYKAEEIIGQHFSKFYLESERVAGVPARSLQVAATQGRFEAEGWRVRKDGSQFWANVVLDPVHDEEGKLIGFAKITRDITERREAQQALQEAHAQLAQAQKMEALGQLTGGVAHDFNNLLMVISGYIGTIKSKLQDDPRGLRAANAIEAAAKRGEALTRQLLAFSRRQSLRPVVVQLRDVLDAIRPMLASTLSGGFRLVETIAADLWPVRLDPNELELALINLIVNARDAMEQSGLVTLTAENVAVPRGTASGDVEGECVAISVADTGSGIPPDVLPRVFDPFFTTKEPGKGTGLGLSQVHGFVHQSGGSVRIASEVGRGTTVTLYLPRAPAAELEQPPPADLETIPAGHLSVLLVEDNKEVAEATRDLLEQLNCRVETSTHAEEALEKLRTARVDLVLSDIVMTGPMNGLDFARAVRRQRPGLPVILATGYSIAAEQAAAEFSVLRKPYGLADLGKAIAAFGGGSRKTSTLLPFNPARRNSPPK